VVWPVIGSGCMGLELLLAECGSRALQTMLQQGVHTAPALSIMGGANSSCLEPKCLVMYPSTQHTTHISKSSHSLKFKL
jgi:hypothetical protein